MYKSQCLLLLSIVTSLACGFVAWADEKPAGKRPSALAVDAQAGGTGFVISANGWLLTCNHVVADAKKVDVILGGKTYIGNVTSQNAAADLAVVRINAQDLPTLSLADSDTAQVGQDVWALGYPLTESLLGL